MSFIGNPLRGTPEVVMKDPNRKSAYRLEVFYVQDITEPSRVCATQRHL